MVRAMDAETQRLRALLDVAERDSAVMRGLAETVSQLQAPLQIFDWMEAATQAAIDQDSQVRAAIERDSQIQALTRGANAHRRFVADLLTNLFTFVERESVQKLMQHGWFPDLDLTAPQIEGWAELFNDHPEQASEALCDRFQELLNDIEAKVKSAFPNRSEILCEAFQAHRQGHYCLSVLAFLTQVDGFFHDRWGKSLFMSGDRADINSDSKKMQNELARQMVQVLLCSDWPLIMTRGTRPDDFTGLNRHQVLHGEVTDYGTEENSLKAISLLNYCAFVLPKPEPTEDNGSE